MVKYISLDEAKKHNKDDSVWIVIHDKVYDVTKFLNEHPGGADALLEVAGTDGTQSFEDVGHSIDARELLDKYEIGVLEKPHSLKVDGCDRGDLSPPNYPPATAKPWRVYDTDDISLSADKPWRTFDIDEPKSKPSQVFHHRKKGRKLKSMPRCRNYPDAEAPRPCSDGFPYIKVALFALAGALVIGYIVKRQAYST